MPKKWSIARHKTCSIALLLHLSTQKNKGTLDFSIKCLSTRASLGWAFVYCTLKVKVASRFRGIKGINKYKQILNFFTNFSRLWIIFRRSSLVKIFISFVFWKIMRFKLLLTRIRKYTTMRRWKHFSMQFEWWPFMKLIFRSLFSLFPQ